MQQGRNQNYEAIVKSEGPRVVIVTSHPISYTGSGGAYRAASVASYLARRFPVTVLQGREAYDNEHSPQALSVLETVDFRRTKLKLWHIFRRGSAEGWAVTRLISKENLKSLSQYDLVYWLDAGLASAALHRFPARIQHVVEFANVESVRYKLLSRDRSVSLKRRLFFLIEGVKARRWERRVLKRSEFGVVLNEHDVQFLQSRLPIEVARNGVDLRAVPQVSNGATVLAVGSWWYHPNSSGLRHFLVDVWPQIRSEIPSARLIVAGLGGEQFTNAEAGVSSVGYVEELSALYSGSAVVLAPARTGGGSQLKVSGAWAHGRIVVGPAHLERERLSHLPKGSLVARDDLAGALVELLLDQRARNEVERGIIAERHALTWEAALWPLAERIAGIWDKANLTPED